MTSPALGFSVFPIRKSALFFPGTGVHSRGMNFPRNGYGWARVLKREAPPHDSGRPCSPAAVPSAFPWKSPLKSGIPPAPAGDGISLPTGIYTWQSTLLSLPHGWPRPPAGNPFPRPGGSCGPSVPIISGAAVFSEPLIFPGRRPSQFSPRTNLAGSAVGWLPPVYVNTSEACSLKLS